MSLQNPRFAKVFWKYLYSRHRSFEMEATMEHRLSLRTPLTMNVAIYYNSLGLLQGRSLDISRNGMFVHTGQLVLPLHAMVDVAFPIEANRNGIHLQRTPAMVVRTTGAGVGLMFAKEVESASFKSSLDGKHSYLLRENAS